MAYAGPPGPPRRLRREIPRVDAHEGSAVRALRRLERRLFFGRHPAGGRGLRALLRAVRTKRTTRPPRDSNCASARLLFPVALRFVVFAPALSRNSGASDRTGDRARGFAGAPIRFRRRREE